MRKDRIEFWVKVAGWSGLLSAFGVLMFYQLTGMGIFLVHLIIIILFYAYTLTTSKEPFWHNSNRVLWILLFSFFFTSIFQAIFVAIVYFKSKKASK